VFRNRQNYDEPLANPLPKLYKEKRDDSEKVRFAVPKPKEQQKKE
jgi:4-hydroxythreonine-4-phosphate dehydrogenase